MFKMSESNTNENYVNKNCRTSSWESHTVDEGVSNEVGHLLAKGQDMGQLATKLYDADNSRDILYYGISIPTDANVNGSDEMLHVYSDKTEAMKIVKKYKKARFKAFKSRQEAVDFAVHGAEIVATSPGLNEISEATSPVIGEKPSPFKGPKAQDLVRLRKVIECGDIYTFRITVWDNPRYLVSSGDTPAILQEGSRYNALHVAAKARNAEICDLILQTVSSVAFVQLLYGDDDMASCKDRAQILLDLYLNTPDKALNETPLHFAVKFGALSVVETLVSYPQCDKHARNKFGQTPRDVICSRVSSPEIGLKRELSNLLDERFYVPVLRSEDNSLQPTVGEPFSPACPLVLKADPINPRMEIRAYAGPMDHEQAVVFRKKWKTPPRMPRTPVRNTSRQAYRESPNPHAYRLQDTEKGLERVGRDLAQEFRVGWNEYWPFLDTFTNLASQDGLLKLEAYLMKRFQDTAENSNQEDISKFVCEENGETKHTVNGCASTSSTNDDSHSSGDGAISPMSDLCFAFKACSLSDDNSGKPLLQNETKTTTNMYDCRGGDANVGMEDEVLLSILLNPGLSPFLYVEKSCQVFAKRISDGLSVVGRNARFSESVLDMLRLEIRHLQDLVSSFKDDARFISVDFNLVHSRIAAIVALKLSELVSDELEFVIHGLKYTISETLEMSYSDEEDNVSISYRNTQTYADHQRKAHGELNQVKCIAKHILSALESDEEVSKSDVVRKEIRIQTEEECMRIWSDAVKCSCLRQNQNFTRNTRKGSSFKRSHSMRYMPPKNKTNCAENAVSSLDGITRRLNFDGGNDSDLRSDNQKTGETIISSHKELNFRTAKQRTCNLSKKQTSNISEVDKSKDMMNTSLSSQKDHLSESDDTSDDEEYITPPSTPDNMSRSESPSCSDDDTNMSTPDEGRDVFIIGDSPSKLDMSVMQALEDTNILPFEYPNIYRWRHLLSLHSNLEKAVWPSSSFCSRPKERSGTPEAAYRDNQRNTPSSTPPQAWHKITGPYSPVSPQRYKNGYMDSI